MAELDHEVVYFNTRLAGMRARLFDQAAVEEMLDQGDLAGMADTLLESPYRQEVAEALSRYAPADAIEDAVSRNLTATFEALLSRAKGEYREMVRFFLGRWDVTAAKSLLRLRHHGLTPDGGAVAVVPGPTLPAALVRELAALPTIEELVAALIRWNPGLCAGLRKQIPAYQESHDLGLLEEALDRGYLLAGMARWTGNPDPNAQILRDQLAAEIDRANLRLVFQRVAGDIDEEDLASRLLPHGTLRASLLRQMGAASDPAGAVELLAGTAYSGLVEELFQLLQTGRFAPVERYLDRLHLNKMRRFARRDVFGIGVLMDYVWRKYNECVNLRLVARGLAGGLPIGRVRDELHFA